MPKKRTHNFKPYTTTATPSSPNPNPSPSSNAHTPSVNEKLSALRLEETPETAAKKRALAETVNQKSVHPSVRSLLGQAETAPPKPKAGVRVRDRDRFRTPGPAAPRSWVSGAGSGDLSDMAGLSGGRRRGFLGRKRGEVDRRRRPREVQRFGQLVGLVEGEGDGAPSLSHLTIKLLARNWEMLSEEDYPALIELPLHLRLQLLSYLGFYGPTIDTKAFQALVQGEEAIHTLDLAGLICHDPLTLRRLTKYFRECRDSDDADAQLRTEAAVADSWDAEDTTSVSLSSLQPTPKFSALTHLSLSHPPKTASWSDLLAFSKLVPQLTHLSLAYWPRPTLTPNLATTTVSNKHGADVNAGGSHFYSRMDSDMAEPHVLLRRLSANLLSLRWLDLEGCEEWVQVFAVGHHGIPARADRSVAGTEVDEWADVDRSGKRTCHDNWRALTYLNCGQGWFPDFEKARAVMTATPPMRPEEYPVFRDVQAYVDGDRPNPVPQGSGDAAFWMAKEVHLQRTGKDTNVLRRSKGCKALTIDCGWRKLQV